MSIVICRECNMDVSSEAATCPHCGIKEPYDKFPMLSEKSEETSGEKRGGGISTFLWLLIGIIVISFLVNLPSQEERLLEKLESRSSMSVIEISDTYNELFEIDPENTTYEENSFKYLEKSNDARNKLYKKETDEILKKLKTINKSEYEKNRSLYNRLLKMHPDNLKYQGKVDYYTRKIKKKVEKEADIKAKEEAAKEAIKEERDAEIRLESNMMYYGKIALRSILKDGDSAKIKDVKYYNSVAPIICGKVNSKNSYGGYQGYQLFISNGDTITLLQDEVSDFHNLWNKLCR